MDATTQLTFLKTRIEEIGSAIFYNLSNAVLKLPTSVVSTVKVDEFGYVWFFVQKPKQNLTEFEQEFPVKMDFYKKGKGCFLQIGGKGFVVTDPEEMNAFVDLPEEQKQLTAGSLTLVKVKIQRADYYQTRSAADTSWWQTTKQAVASWFGQHSYRPDNRYFPAS